MRIAKLCRFVAEKLPKSHIPKQWVAKIANALSKLPPDGSDPVGEKLMALVRSAERILRRESGDYIIKHRFLGVRMTVDDDDKVAHPFREKRGRMEKAIDGMAEVAGNINLNNCSADKRKEVAQYNKYSGLLEEWRQKVPLQLPPGDDETK